jgi:hypothetical protein
VNLFLRRLTSKPRKNLPGKEVILPGMLLELA